MTPGILDFGLCTLIKKASTRQTLSGIIALDKQLTRVDEPKSSWSRSNHIFVSQNIIIIESKYLKLLVKSATQKFKYESYNFFLTELCSGLILNGSEYKINTFHMLYKDYYNWNYLFSSIYGFKGIGKSFLVVFLGFLRGA